jgi:SAM-dependent methyltransferase
MDSKIRFSNRVDNYVKYRPSYPKEAIDFLYQDLGFTDQSTIADIGSGTGIFTKLLLLQGSVVQAVEPNTEMRLAAEAQLSDFGNFFSIQGTAENTQLESQSVDFIVSAQAFHWFDRKLAKIEFTRILRPRGKVVLVWNHRHSNHSPFDQAYENLLLKFGKDYEQVKHTNIEDSVFEELFKDGIYMKKTFANSQNFDFEGLKGRLLSSSYSPVQGEANYEEMIEALLAIFEQYKENNIVTFYYDTEIYVGET